MHHMPLAACVLVAVLPAQWQATDAVAQIVQFTGFESGDLREFQSVTGTAVVQSSVVRSGNHAMRCETILDGYSYATLFRDGPNGAPTASLNLTDMYVSMWFRYAAATNRSRIAEVGGTSDLTTKARLELEVDRRLSIQDFNHTNRFFSTTALAPDRWYRIRWYVGTGLVAGTVLMIDDKVEISVANATLSEEATRRFHVGRSSTVGGPIDFYYDDVIISTGGFAEDCEVRLLRPDGQGAHNSWTGTFADVDDWPDDGDATVCESTGTATAMTFALQDPAALGISSPVLALKALAVVRRLTGSSTTSALRLRSGIIDDDAVLADPGELYLRLRGRVYTADPATGRAWTAAGLQDLEVGYVNGPVGGTTRITAVGASLLVVRT